MARRRIGGAAAGAGALAACLLVAGCAGSSDGSAEPSTPPPAPGPGALGLGGSETYLGLCGSVTDDEVAQATGVDEPLHAVRDPVGCVWNTGDPFEGVNISYTRYRGSPIGRERSIDGAVGRVVRDVTIGGRPGFTSRSGRTLCEAGVGVGVDGEPGGVGGDPDGSGESTDFFLWSVAYGLATPRADPCEAATALARMTVERAR